MFSIFKYERLAIFFDGSLTRHRLQTFDKNLHVAFARGLVQVEICSCTFDFVPSIGECLVHTVLGQCVRIFGAGCGCRCGCAIWKYSETIVNIQKIFWCFIFFIELVAGLYIPLNLNNMLS